MDIEGKLLNIKQAEMLLLDDKEVGNVAFQIQAETGTIEAYALASEGTAFHTLENDTRLRAGVGVKVTGAQTEIGFKVLTIRPSYIKSRGAAIADIEVLKNRAIQNMNLAKGELHALLSIFPPDSPQHYAIAVQLRRHHGDKTVAIAEKVCRCQQCRSTFELDSPRYTFAWGKTRCHQCHENVEFDLVDPLPREKDETETLSFEEIQKRLKERFGGSR